MMEQIEKKIAKLEIIKDTVTMLNELAECYAPDPENGEHSSEYQEYRYNAYKDIISLLLKQV